MYWNKLSEFVLFLNSICAVFSVPLEDYIDFDLINNNKSYSFEFQSVLFPCPKLYEFCGDSKCCDGLQCTDTTIEEDTDNTVFERFFCGNASKTYDENVTDLFKFIEDKKKEETEYFKNYADPNHHDISNTTLANAA